MKWVDFLILVQAVLVLIFIIVFFFQISIEESFKEEKIENHLEKGYLPSISGMSLDNFPKIAVILIVVAVIEMIVIMRMFN